MSKSKQFNWTLILLSGLLLFLIFYYGSLGQKEKATITLDRVLSLARENKIKEITFLNQTEFKITTTEEKVYYASKDPDLSLWQFFQDNDIPIENLQKIRFQQKADTFQNVLLAILVNILPLAIIIFLFWRVFRQAQKGTMQIFSFGKSGIKVYNPNDPDRVTFKDVANLEEAKEELQEVVEFLKQPERFLQIGARIPRGVLLVGPPGSGKTLLARAVAAEAKVPFFYISGSEFVEMFVGVGASRVRDAFSMAKRNAPSILFIDEIDAVGRARGAGIGGGHDEREQTLNQILVEMDGFEKGTKVVVMAATNRPDILDPALLRPGRFDRKVILDLPDIKAREEILRIHLRDKKVGKVNLKQVAQRTAGFSGADLANLCNEAAILAARRKKKEITQKELLDSIEKVILGPERKSKIYSKKEKEVAAYHEAGHAIVAHYLKNTNPVEKISIIARGRAGGYTLKLPKEDRSFHFRHEFLDELAVLLGGYVSEKLTFQDVSTGASNDLEVATDLARQLVIRYGMSEKFGPMVLGKTKELIFLGKELTMEKEYSEKTAEEIDQEVKKLLDQAYQRAEKVLTQKREILDKVAQALIKKETLERKQFERLVGEPKGSFPV